MPLPDTIPVRYTEEDAGYLSMRPVVKQTFRLSELVDLVVSVVGKDAARVQQIFHVGTVVYSGYRYWWEELAAELSEVRALLVPFPDDDPGRAFNGAGAVAALLEMGGGTLRQIVEITRKEAKGRKWFKKTGPWDVLLQVAASSPPRYEKYSQARRADLFRVTLSPEVGNQLLAALREAAPRALRRRWSTLRPPAALTFLCPR